MNRRSMPRALLAATLAFAFAGCLPSNAKRTTVSGTIETDEVRVASRYGGRVEKIHAQEGDTLKAGQVIAELAADELRARRDQAAALLAEWQAGPRKEELAAAKQDWEAQVAELRFAEAESIRAKDLYAQKVIAEADRDRAASRVEVLEKAVAAAESRHQLLLAGTRPERLAYARAQLAEIDAQLREMSVTAPSECILEVLNVKVGDVLQPNRELATLLLPDRLWVRVFVPETWLGRIKLGETVRLRVDAFPERDFEGTVEQIGRTAEFTPRNVQTVEERIKQVFPVKIRLNHKEGLLRAGIAADVAFANAPGPKNP